MSHKSLSLLQTRHCIITAYWYLESTNNIIFNAYSLEFCIITSSYCKKVNDIRSFLNKNINNNNYNRLQIMSSDNQLINGCFGCIKGCGLCTTQNKNGTALLLQGDYYVSYKLDYIIPIKQHFNCKSTWVTYIMICICCGLENIGSTKQEVKLRIGQHKNCILNNIKAQGYPFVKHFNKINSKCYCKDNKLKNLRVMIIDGLKDPKL
eukprot:543479_1